MRMIACYNMTIFQIHKSALKSSKNQEIFFWFNQWALHAVTDTGVSMYLSIATDHLLSIKSVAASRVAGHANAARKPLKTVLIAPCFINSKASPASIAIHVNQRHLQ